MTGEEYDATAPGQAIKRFIKFMMSAVVIAIGSEMGGYVTNVVGWLVEAKSLLNPDRTATEAVAAFDRQHQAALRKGLLVIASWSAFEGCVEDFTKGLMRMDPNRFEHKQFGLRTVAHGDMTSEDDRNDVYASIERSVNRSTRGIDRFEELFAKADLTGDVLAMIEPGFTNALAIRNVWAHNAGYADPEFVRTASGLAFAVGDLVDVDLTHVSDCLTALITYAMIVANRHRQACGVGPMPMEGKPRDTPIGRAYVARYPTS
ncbi:hypothetical protein [Mycobacterium sp. SP-6446]|uniref:hypothetical protein n=1 Tax=Mycobacterium sp. SP-6446 TaxID=1834162 RepID=UPI00096EFFC0|nr:hypothetical protein [Mycobacterium sp. SP-6446]OMC14955.1 hypothetical protein A5736_20450 [Mycobacterium sp. SP-6446]